VTNLQKDVNEVTTKYEGIQEEHVGMITENERLKRELNTSQALVG
jgi:regulator of replication initiation timing